MPKTAYIWAAPEPTDGKTTLQWEKHYGLPRAVGVVNEDVVGPKINSHTAAKALAVKFKSKPVVDYRGYRWTREDPRAGTEQQTVDDKTPKAEEGTPVPTETVEWEVADNTGTSPVPETGTSPEPAPEAVGSRPEKKRKRRCDVPEVPAGRDGVEFYKERLNQAGIALVTLGNRQAKNIQRLTLQGTAAVDKTKLAADVEIATGLYEAGGRVGHPGAPGFQGALQTNLELYGFDDVASGQEVDPPRNVRPRRTTLSKSRSRTLSPLEGGTDCALLVGDEALGRFLENYKLLQYFAVTTGACGYISLAFCLGWTVSEVVKAIVAQYQFRQGDFVSLEFGKCTGNMDNKVLQRYRKKLNTRKDALAAAKLPTEDNPDVRMGESLWLNTDRDLKAVAHRVRSDIIVILAHKDVLSTSYSSNQLECLVISKDFSVKTETTCISSDGSFERWDYPAEGATPRSTDIVLLYDSEAKHFNAIAPPIGERVAAQNRPT